MGADARMAGRTRPRAHCRLPGHGMRCEVAHEKIRSKGRARERAELRREISAERDGR
jgi:hypothetical protein